MTGSVLALASALAVSQMFLNTSIDPGPKSSSVVLKNRVVTMPERPPAKAQSSKARQVTTGDATPTLRCETSVLDGDIFCSPAHWTPPPDGKPGRKTKKRELTVGDVQRAAREIGMPRLGVEIQPGGRTLVNVATIFHTTPRVLRRSVTLLGEDVDLVARPTSYTWHHGDGTSQVTSGPGRPYPSKDVTHRYRHTGRGLAVSLDTTWSVQYRLNGGAWQDLGTTLTAGGPATRIDVRQAAPVLVTP